MALFLFQPVDASVLVWRQGEGSASAAPGSARTERRFDALADGVFVWGRRRPIAAAVTLDLEQTSPVALSGAASVGGDIQIATALDLVQSGAIALSGSVSLSGDVQFGVGFDLAQTNVVALSGSLAVSGDVQSSLVPVVVPQGGAGRPRRRVRRVVVEIDGEDFIVNSEEEASALLDKAKAEAEKAAKVQIQRAAKAAERKPRKVISDARKTLVLPEIKAPGLEEYVSQVLSEIRDSYSSAMRTIEVAALLRKRDRDEEDDEDVLMLML